MDLPKRVRIVSDGTGQGTTILDERGDPISKHVAIEGVRWSIKARELARAEIDLCITAADVDGMVHYFVALNGERQEIDRIRFKDGTEWILAPALPDKK